MTTYKGKITGDLILKEGDDVSKVTSIGGSLYVRSGASCGDLSALTSIGGSLYVTGSCGDLSALTSIGGSLDVRSGASCGDLSALTSIGGYQLPDSETARARLIEVAKNALADPANLTMDSWHNESGQCSTSHCIAGWAVHLRGKEGYDLEKEVGQPMAGNILLGAEASKMFYLTNDAARSALHKILAEEVS